MLCFFRYLACTWTVAGMKKPNREQEQLTLDFAAGKGQGAAFELRNHLTQIICAVMIRHDLLRTLK